jgi:hypothetical protein
MKTNEFLLYNMNKTHVNTKNYLKEVEHSWNAMPQT